MKTVKIILLVLGIIILVPLIIALFVNNEYTVAREITVNRPRHDVFEYIKLQKNQDYFNKWVMRDPEMKKEFRGTDGTPGFVYGWNGNKDAGEGEMEIKKVMEGEGVETEIRFKRPMENTANASMLTESAADGQTKVKWAMTGRNKYPLNFMNLFIDKLLGGDMETSLGTLKGILEKQPGSASLNP